MEARETMDCGSSRMYVLLLANRRNLADTLVLIEQPGITKRSVQLTVYPARNLARWMAVIPDSRLMNTIYIPGTHVSY